MDGALPEDPQSSRVRILRAPTRLTILNSSQSSVVDLMAEAGREGQESEGEESEGEESEGEQHEKEGEEDRYSEDRAGSIEESEPDEFEDDIGDGWDEFR